MSVMPELIPVELLEKMAVIFQNLHLTDIKDFCKIIAKLQKFYHLRCESIVMMILLKFECNNLTKLKYFTMICCIAFRNSVYIDASFIRFVEMEISKCSDKKKFHYETILSALYEFNARPIERVKEIL